MARERSAPFFVRAATAEAETSDADVQLHLGIRRQRRQRPAWRLRGASARQGFLGASRESVSHAKEHQNHQHVAE